MERNWAVPFSTDILRGVRVCPVWIAPEWVTSLLPGADIDAAGWLESSRIAGVSSLLLITKQHDGRCIWPTSFETLHMGHDILGEFCSLAPAQNIRIFAYYSAGIDDFQLTRHPEWAFVDSKGEGCRSIGFGWACMNSPYGDFVLAQIEEILSGYKVDCVWLDIFNLAPDGSDCHCVFCVEKFRDATGHELAAQVGTQVFETWKAACLEGLLQRISDARSRLQPEAALSFNGAGGGLHRHPYLGPEGLGLLDLVDFLSVEGHDSRFESAVGKSLTAQGKPFEILTSGSIANEWVGWVTKPSPLLCLELAVVGAHGGSFGVGVSVLPDGQFPVGEMDLIADVVDFWDARKDWFEQSPIASDVHVLVQPYREREEYLPPERPIPQPRLERGPGHHIPELREIDFPCNGLWDVLREHHIAFDFVHETTPLDDKKVLVIQSSARLSVELCDRIRQFVRSGGNLLVEGHGTLLDENGNRREDFALSDVLGVHFRGYAGAWDANYLQLTQPALQESLPSYPILVMGPALKIEPKGAISYAQLLAPLGGEHTAEKHTASLFNPPTTTSQGPAITRNEFGNGSALYISTAIGEHIARRRNVDPWTKQLVANMVKDLTVQPLYRTDAPAGLEIICNEVNPTTLVFHFLNHYVGAEHITTHQPPRLAEFNLWLNTARTGTITATKIVPADNAIAQTHENDNWTKLHLPELDIHYSLIITRQTPNHTKQN